MKMYHSCQRGSRERERGSTGQGSRERWQHGGRSIGGGAVVGEVETVKPELSS